MVMNLAIVERKTEVGEMMRVILVDEENIVLRTLGDFLQDLDHDVMSFETVANLLESSVAQAPDHEKVCSADLILMDTGAPKEQQKEIISKVHARFPSADILLMSDQRITLPHDFAMANRVFGYMTKPVRLGELELYLSRIKEGRDGRCET